MKKFKKGVASFYIVSFSTLILVIIAASFATVIISEVTRASNDDLSQSAYDSALAGVEDAKLAFANYRRCLETDPNVVPKDLKDDPDTPLSCANIIWIMNNSDKVGCDMVALMIGRVTKRDWVDGNAKEVLISDTSTNNEGVTSDLNQAYTCVEIKTVLKDYRANLTSSNNVRLVKVELDKEKASEIKAVELSWYSMRDGETFNYSNFDKKVMFKPIAEVRPSSPPTIRLQLMQTAENFTLGQAYGIAEGKRTDRATLFFVPTNDVNDADKSRSESGNYIGVHSGDEDTGKNEVTVEQVVKTNAQSVVNTPYVVYCSDSNNNGFMCSVKINLPEPIGGVRDDDTFMFLVMVPYGEPDTDFAMKFLCADDRVCSSTFNSNDEVIDTSNVAEISGVQIVIDSTGRANDLYRRVETRLESADVSFPYVYYAVQLLGDDEELLKTLTVTSEYDRNYYRTK